MQLPIDLQVGLFNRLVESIVVYRCEIWGFGNIGVIECVHTIKIRKIYTKT